MVFGSLGFRGGHSVPGAFFLRVTPVVIDRGEAPLIGTYWLIGLLFDFLLRCVCATASVGAARREQVRGVAKIFLGSCRRLSGDGYLNVFLS
jgi:hypothetical protein